MLNLLIAIMGGSYENVEGRAYNEGLKARAQLLVDFETTMDDEEKRDPRTFPEWLFMFLPADREAIGGTNENGVVNGVKRRIEKLYKDLCGEMKPIRELSGSVEKVNELNTRMCKIEDMLTTLTHLVQSGQ